MEKRKQKMEMGKRRYHAEFVVGKRTEEVGEESGVPTLCVVVKGESSVLSKYFRVLSDIGLT